MFKTVKPVFLVCTVIFSLLATAQPAKPTAKPAIAVKKIDYSKMKEDVRSLFQDDKFTQAITKANQYLQKFPGDTQTVYLKAASHILLKQNEEGYNQIKNFFKSNDTTAVYLSILSFTLPDKYRLTSGIECAEEAIRIAPSTPWGYFAKAGVYADFKQTDKTLPLMEKANNLITTDGDEKIMRSFYAKQLEVNGQHDKAVTTINTLYKKYPKDNNIVYDYAMILFKGKEYEKALTKFDEALVIDSTDNEAKSNRIATLSAMGKNDLACEAVEKLIDGSFGYGFMRYRYRCQAYFATPAITDITTATWAVDFNGKNYDFTVKNVKGDISSGMEFDWVMTSGNNMNGHVALSKEATASATAQNNKFGPDMKKAIFTDKTTVWVSKAVITNLLTKGSSKMDVGEGEEEFTVIPDVYENRDDNAFDDFVSVKTEEKYVNTLHVKNADGGRQLWILNDEKNPLIVKMSIGWSITLKSID